MDIKEQKRQLRKKIKEIKDNIPLAEKVLCSSSVWLEIEKHTLFKSAKTIMLYWSMDDEVYTHNFIQKWCRKKQIILPQVVGNNLELKEFTGVNNMKLGEFNIFEPIGESLNNTSTIDLIIVPGIAFDKQNNRMGRGKGFYDKLLQQTTAYKIGVCFDFQLQETIPIETFDIKMDEVIASSK